ncbi:NAD-dependent deacetylase sirtuin-2 [Thozetella sp. PMI_491]|nr:NAD-dependent deacetylase sirtuin-2 [Thozetella sp. PMI_491]
MGQENSIVDESVAPETLSSRSLDAVAEYIKSGQARRIVVMTGAGLSTAAGIPDFRSPDTGLYANLARLNLPYAEAVFDINYFRRHPEPFYMLAKELYPGRYHPTISHVFIALLADKGLLHHLFTQNIDCLERRAGVPDELIVEAHGSFATQRCIECGTVFPDDRMKDHVEKGDVPHCASEGCDGLVKPDIVFFGEALPQVFRDRQYYPSMSDLALVLGTSLTVHPFAGLPDVVRPKMPRVLFNLEQVGNMGSRPDDVLVLGDCDSGVRKLADALGWREELEAKWRETVGEKEAQRQLRVSETRATEKKEMDQLVDRMREGLNLENESSSDDGDAASLARPKEDEDEVPKSDSQEATTETTASAPKEGSAEEKGTVAGETATESEKKDEGATPEPREEAKAQASGSSADTSAGKAAL